jgi:adenylosuccinate synthase
LNEDLIEPIYEELPGWSEDLTQVTDVNMLPQALKDYIAFIEEECGVPVKLVSVGPDRVQTLHR